MAKKNCNTGWLNKRSTLHTAWRNFFRRRDVFFLFAAKKHEFDCMCQNLCIYINMCNQLKINCAVNGLSVLLLKKRPPKILHVSFMKRKQKRASSRTSGSV